LGLSYNSSFKGKGRAETWLGVGWQLTGFSSIERVSVGGGTPTYDDNYDLFRLDGMELMVCRDAAPETQLPLTRNYPDRYETDRSSASCLAGGNLSTMVESYRKIEMKYQTIGAKQVEYFEVTNTKGVRYTYRPVGALAGDAASGSDDEYNMLFRRKFLLTEIRDTQATPNIVTFSYNFSGKAEARAHRPDTIQYGNGYKVSFGYDRPSDPMSSYAVGSGGHFGKQYFRLRSVFVHDGSAKIRAYGLEYQNTTVTNASLLTSVTPYGSDFMLNAEDGSLISGGSTLPGKFRTPVYAPDINAVTQQSFAGKVFHRGLQVLDVDGNNKDDLIFADLYNKVRGTVTSFSCSGGGALQLFNPPQFEASKNGSGNFVLNARTAHPILSTLNQDPPVSGSTHTKSVVKGIVPPDGVRSDYGLLLHDTHSTYENHDTHSFIVDSASLRFVGLGSNGADYVISSAQTDYTGNPIAGNFDTDPDQEFYVQYQSRPAEHIRLTNQGATKQTIGIGALNNYSALLAQLDMDGDGMKELVYGSRYNGTTPWNPRTYFDGDVGTGFPVANNDFPASSPGK